MRENSDILFDLLSVIIKLKKENDKLKQEKFGLGWKVSHDGGIHCEDCGKKVESGDKYCWNCGNKFVVPASRGGNSE